MMLLSIIKETTIDYEQLDDIIMSTKQNTTRQNIRNIIFVIISCCFIYAILSFLYLRQKRVLDKNEFLFINEFLSTICLIYFRDSFLINYFNLKSIKYRERIRLNLEFALYLLLYKLL